ncbi:MAG TPA: F0F1 ATP synthase subunit A [Sphingobacterium sp.]|nr:F0F1 ATP synthase subunit A [Sphingobacterium sp.]
MKISHILGLRKTWIALFCAGVFFFAGVQAQEKPSSEEEDISSLEKHEEENDFNINELISHHIGDSHEFTFWGGDKMGKTKWVGLYLPVILYTDSGLQLFSSKAFQHDEAGKVLVEKKGQEFVRYEGKIYYANSSLNKEGTYVTLDSAEEVTNARPLDFSITKNVVSLFVSLILLLWLFFSVAKGYRKNNGKAPKGVQSVMEPIMLFVRDEIAIPNLGHKYERFMPYLLTVFFFIWMNNMLGLFPFFPGSTNVTGNIAITGVLAVFTLLITVFNGNKYYWGHIFNPPVPWWIKPIIIPVEIIGIFTKPFALAIRLFANITAGHILVLSLLSLPFIFATNAVAPGSVLFMLFIGLIKFLVAFIQAFIFTILSAVFIGMAVEAQYD